MQKSFENDLAVKNSYAKSELGIEAGDEIELSYLEISLGEMAEDQNTTPEVERAVYELQKQKQEIMQKLKGDLACLDDDSCNFEIKNGAREVKFVFA